MQLSSSDVIEALRPVEDPELRRSIVDLEMVREVEVSEEGTVQLTVALTVPGCPLKAEIDSRIRHALSALEGVRDVRVDFTVMTDAERERLRSRLGGVTESAQGEAARAIPFSNPDSATRVLLIASGKGGVGKSSVTTNLSVALAQQGKEVAVVDADVWGFSIPRMLGVDRPPVVIDDLLVPPEANGVRCISIGFFAREDQPVIWRGPMLHKALEQFLTDVWWGEPDFLLVDLPPGTGDVSISLAQFLPKSEVYVVTTPQPAAQKVAQRAAHMARQVHLDVRGVIENMSWFVGQDGQRYEIFGSGGGRALAESLGVPLVAQIPLDEELRQGGDEGRPIVVSHPESEAAEAFRTLARRIVDELAPRRVHHPELKIL